jgi:superfamily I DNA/RNA helicase
MVDEYQDTNRPQYLLIQRLASRHRNLCVVGDPDQSIYKWRGADLRNILDFEHDFPEATIVRLERNYRSTQVILDAASSVIAQNRNRKEKRLYTDRAGGARVLYYRAGDDIDEAEFIARRCRDALHDDVENTVAILYRTNAQSRTIEDALRRSGTDYKIIVSADGFASLNSALFAVAPADAAAILYTLGGQPPTTPVVAGAVFPIQVRIVDEFGNLATGFSEDVSLDMHERVEAEGKVD